MVRSPSKLEQLLRDKGISEEIQQKYLRIVTGNATDIASVENTLRDPSGKLASMIISGVGGTPRFTPNPLRPTLDQPNICQDSIEAIVKAVRALNTAGGSYTPYIIAISTTGVDDSVDDVPWLMHPLYHW